MTLSDDLEQAIELTAQEIRNEIAATRLGNPITMDEIARIVMEERLGPLLSISEYFCNGSFDWDAALQRAKEPR